MPNLDQLTQWFFKDFFLISLKYFHYFVLNFTKWALKYFFLDFVNVCLLICYYSPFEKSGALHLSKLELP